MRTISLWTSSLVAWKLVHLPFWHIDAEELGRSMSFVKAYRTIDAALCLAQLRSLLESSPDFYAYTATSREHQEWLARAHAFIKKLNDSDALTIRLAPGMLTSTLFRDSEVAKIFGIIHRAIAELELEPQKTEQQAFASGAVYDFFNALKTALASASSAIFVIDPYLDDQIFDTYLANTPAGVSVRLLAHKYGNLRSKNSIHNMVPRQRCALALSFMIAYCFLMASPVW